MQTIGVVAVALVMVVGLVLTIVPFVPGLLVIWLAGVVHVVAVGLDGPAWVLIGILTGLGLVGGVASLVLPHRSAAALGASWVGLVGGVAGAIVGMIVLPVLGFPIGGVLGILLAERLRTGDTATAWTITKAAIRGFGIGAIVEILSGVLMVGAWLAWFVWR